MLEPSTQRVRLNPIPRRPSPEMVTSDDSIVVRIGGPWWPFLILYLVVIVSVVWFGADLRVPALTIAVWLAAATLLSLAVVALLIFLAGGVHHTRVWQFAPGRVTRVMRFPLPERIWPRRFDDVEEFEIVHELWTKGIFTRSLYGGHHDKLRFWTRRAGEPVTIMLRSLSDSSATLRGPDFTQSRASEIEREILPEVLTIAALASEKVGVPLYVIEGTSYVGSDVDG